MAKKDKSNVTVNLPKARASMRRQKEVSQMKATNEDAWKAVGYILVILLILFILLGGISQTGAWNVAKNWSHNVGEKIARWLDGGDVVVNDDGIYWDPTGTNPEGVKNQQKTEENNTETTTDDAGSTDSTSETENTDSNSKESPNTE